MPPRTRNLIGIPLVLLSDVFGHPASWTWLEHANAWLPTAWATRLLFGDVGGSLSGALFGWMVTTLGWVLAAGFVARVVLARATRAGTLEVI